MAPSPWYSLNMATLHLRKPGVCGSEIATDLRALITFVVLMMPACPTLPAQPRGPYPADVRSAWRRSLRGGGSRRSHMAVLIKNKAEKLRQRSKWTVLDCLGRVGGIAPSLKNFDFEPARSRFARGAFGGPIQGYHAFLSR